MTVISNVLHLDDTRSDIIIDDGKLGEVDGSKLLKLPGLIDPHVHFRVPGMEYKEDWATGSEAAFYGGYTTVFDMPNTIPATNTYERFIAKCDLINSQLANARFPLKYKLFFGADRNNFHQIHLVKDQIIGIKVFMGSSTGDLLLDDASSLHAIYAIARAFNLIIALHAEDEEFICNNSQKYAHETDFKYHSLIRAPEAAAIAVKQVIELSRLYNVTSYILHVSTQAEIDLIRKAKESGIPVLAETCAHYLFLDDSMYGDLLGRLKMNPPIRTKDDREYLWQALRDGVIDTIASDHAPHTLAEKHQPLAKCPSGVPGVETTLPLLITAYRQGKISLERIVELTHTRAQQIFALAASDDYILVNIEDYHTLTDDMMHTKVKWSPYAGMSLTGYPQYVYTNQQLFTLTRE